MAKKARREDNDIAEDIDEVEPAEDKGEEVAVAEEDAPPDEPPEEPSEDRPAPKGRNTRLTIALSALNVVGAIAFAYLLVLDYQKRQEWSHAVFMNELFIQGLPLKQEDDGPSASRVTFPRQKLDSNQLNEVFRQRGGKGGGEFWAVDEAFPNRIQAKSLTPAILKEYFGTLGVPVKTLEEEITRLKSKVPADIAASGKETVEAFKKKGDAAKRQFVASLLLPIGYDTYQVDKLDAKIKSAKGANLDNLIDEAVQRQMLLDILAPCAIYRPGEVSKPLVEKAGDLGAIKLEQLNDLLQKRFNVAIANTFDGSVHQGPDWDGKPRLSWEKRQTIGFLLVAIANLHKPDPAKPGQFELLYPESGAAPGTPNLPRAQTVLGLYEFAAAAQNLPLAWYALEQRVLQSIHDEREGASLVKDGKLIRNQAFIDKYDGEINAIQDLVLEIRKAQGRFKDLQEQTKDVKKIYEDRDDHLKNMTKKLLAARQETARRVTELRELQKQLFAAQAVLRDAQQKNNDLERAIRAEEQRALSKTGAKTP